MDRELPYRIARDEIDARAFARLLELCFASPPEHAGSWAVRAGLENVRLLGERDTPSACVGLLPMGQWFGGRRVSCAGIAAVGVRPEERGRGHARRVMRCALAELAERQFALSALYPATLTLYRGLGFETAGGRYEVRVPCSALATSARVEHVVPIADANDAAMRACYARVARASNGWLDRHEALWIRLPELRGEVRDGYAVRGADDSVRGYVWLARRAGTNLRQELTCADFVAEDADAARTLFGFLAAHRSLAGDIAWFGGAADFLRDALPEIAWKQTLHLPWMLRIVDVRRALEERGYSTAVRARVDLEVRDELLGTNHGRFRVEVEAGRAHVHPGGEGRVRLDVRDLAAIYTGHTSAANRARLGSLVGDPRDVDLLSGMFAGEAPAMPDFF